MPTDREMIDRLVNFRKTNLGWLDQPMRTKLDAKTLTRCLDLPEPRVGQEYPKAVTYRGLRLLAR